MATEDRRGRSLAETIRAEESYGVLFVLILFSLTATAALGSFSFGPELGVMIQGGVLLYALWTSRSGQRALRAALIVLPILMIVGSLAQGTSSVAGGVLPFISALFIAAAIVAIVRSVADHPRIDGSTIMGVLSIYLLFGMFFASTYTTVAGFSGDSFFASGAASPIDYLYFSFVTLTTTGYGDLVAAAPIGRMLAVTEALLGQLYLVSVVALVVANAGQERRRGQPPP